MSGLNFKRKLTALISADVKASSLLMDENEQASARMMFFMGSFFLPYGKGA
jgi:hypothetical protein